MAKNSFTILETIISIVIVSLLISSFFQISQSTNSIENYKELNTIQNQYAKTNEIKETQDFSFE